MNTGRLTATLSLALTAGMVSVARAQTIQTIGAGSAVTHVDRLANFNALATNGTPLSDYSEGNLIIATDGDSWVGEGSPVFDPFHGANGNDHAFYFPFGGSYGWTSISAADSHRLYALEFMYGNGWTTGDIYGVPWGNHDAVVHWQAWRGNAVVSSGTVGDQFILEMGTVLGFADSAGFDRLDVRCTIWSSADPNLQALALDNLRVQTGAVCYANCDASSTPPLLNVADFTCFLQKFAQADPYANCDGSLSPPALNVADFTCFLQKFAQGCP